MSEEEQAALANIYKQLGIDGGNRGCIMLDTEPLLVSDVIPAEELYVSSEHKYVNGVVSETVPHVTLLYGLMQTGKELQPHIDELFTAAKLSVETVTVDSVDYFESAYDEEYYCIVAKLVVTEELTKGHGLLRNFYHINRFTLYQPHITLAYIKKKANVRDYVIATLNDRFKGQEVKVVGLNYGD